MSWISVAGQVAGVLRVSLSDIFPENSRLWPTESLYWLVIVAQKVTVVNQFSSDLIFKALSGKTWSDRSLLPSTWYLQSVYRGFKVSHPCCNTNCNWPISRCDIASCLFRYREVRAGGVENGGTSCQFPWHISHNIDPLYQYNISDCTITMLGSQ